MAWPCILSSSGRAEVWLSLEVELGGKVLPVDSIQPEHEAVNRVRVLSIAGSLAHDQGKGSALMDSFEMQLPHVLIG